MIAADDTPACYQSARVFRQDTQGEWSDVIDRVRSALQHQCNADVPHEIEYELDHHVVVGDLVNEAGDAAASPL
jgi:hypothetical protein